MVRWYVSLIIVDEFGVYRPAIQLADPPVDTSMFMPVHANGIPFFQYALVKARAPHGWAGVDADPRNHRLFAGVEGERASELELLTVLETLRWASVGSTQKTRIKFILGLIGVPDVDLTGQTNLRAILQKVGRQLHINFDETKLTY